jgi:DNA replication initiation complex subunit (GINS family)
MVEKDKYNTIFDLEKIVLSHTQKINYLKSELETHIDDKLTAQSIEQYVSNNKILLLDSFGEGSLIICNLQNEILYPKIDKIISMQNDKLPDRNYLRQIIKNPDQTIFGNIVIGAISKLPSIPIVTGLKNKYGQHIGNIILSSNLDKLSQNFYKGYVNIITIVGIDTVSSTQHDLNKSTFFSFFLKNIINSEQTFEVITKYNPSIGIKISYNINALKLDFFYSMLRHFVVIFVIGVTILVLYYRFILLPLRPALKILDNLLPIIDTQGNLFCVVGGALEKQEQYLLDHKFKLQEQNHKLLSMICSVSTIGHYIKNRLEYLVEEIDSDMFKQLLPEEKRIFEELKYLIYSSESEIKSVISHCIKLFALLGNKTKTAHHMIDLLIKSGISQQIITRDNDIEIYCNLYKDLFLILVEEITYFSKYDVTLIKVILDTQTNILSFHFQQHYNALVEGYNEQYTICKLWASFNNINITLVNEREQFIINCSLENCISSTKKSMNLSNNLTAIIY